ncbi:excalibur calcium-binding domain-containing protein [Vannielia litorea]|uniref:excalibur calcium-binding domain-containing protein n=1 Tax=Vannielia litorea TaxID=1217970 RepID=UPI001C93C986|nr:excalibur calcium-binding domain-containing protein [Vannielia litorea]MBY6048585.1 excalibur calcium-binding domain-containing protein [Vannielia litorea]MBY6075999.1 excalibur calcium-binding domain-containing protein [Vannielia litorea]
MLRKIIFAIALLSPAHLFAQGCHTSYQGACVPIASDVDCAGGRGNGPAYVRGPVYVVGPDVYGLDRDGDGIACEK